MGKYNQNSTYQTVKTVTVFFLFPGGGAVDDTNKMLIDIRERVVRVETKIDSMTDVRVTANQAKSDAAEALQYGKSAHKRIDDLKDGQKWLWRTIAGAFVVGLVGGLVALIWQGLGV